MLSKNKLLMTDVLSVFASGLSDVAIITLAYLITKSPETISYIITLRLLSSILVFYLMPKALKIISMKKLSIITDLTRAISCTMVIFSWDIYLLAIFTVIVSFCTGINSALKNVAFQKHVTSEERVAFISKQQLFYNAFGISAPIISSIIIKYTDIRIVFILESLLFITSSAFIYTLSDWSPRNFKQNKPILSGFNYIFKDKAQKNILFFRLSILTSMVAYQVISVYMLSSQYRELIASLNVGFITSYSDVIAIFSFTSALSAILGSLLSGKLFNMESLNKSFISGSVMISLGCMLWAFPIINTKISLYIIGTLLIFTGLSFLRVALYTSGQELTDKELFSEIIITSDMIARTYQSLIGFIIVTFITFSSPETVFIITSLAALASIIFSSPIYKKFIMKSRE